LNKISNYLNLSKTIRNNAAYFYKRIIKNEEKVINNISLIAFCVFFAARKENHNAPITINEISKAFQNYGHRVNPRLILRDGLEYKKYLRIENTPHKSEDYINRLVNEIINYRLMDERLKKKNSPWTKKKYQMLLLKKSHYILKELPGWQRGGRNPFILTGAIIYLADRLLAKEFGSKNILTQKIISRSTKIAEYSIRDHYVNLLKPIFLKKG
jgi:transcription initiation factor TFIIIB Brf1 subunit/transcription initiation factor TFIIB